MIRWPNGRELVIDTVAEHERQAGTREQRRTATETAARAALAELGDVSVVVDDAGRVLDLTVEPRGGRAASDLERG